jgi:type II secretory pathway component PulC
LDPIDQLQVMFLRLMLEPEVLQAMNGRELLAFALERGLIGGDLRRSDVLGEIVVGSNSAQGRLYKFGHANRLDRGLQYFALESGGWRIDLRGELERLRAEFASFLERSGLAPSEAAFFILEMRLMRKVTPADFVPPLGPERVAPAVVRANETAAEPILRLVAIRHSSGAPEESAATIEDRVESLRYVLHTGDSLPADPRYRLIRIDRDAAVLRASDGERTLRLDRDAGPLNRRLRLSGMAARPQQKSLVQQAEAGSGREGLMAQWRNVGMRERPQLLQQGWLTAEYAGGSDASRRMAGLRVRKLVAGSFWHQLGMQEGDLLEEMNGLRIDSTDAWRKVLEIAQSDQAITISVQRSAAERSYRTETIRPR